MSSEIDSTVSTQTVTRRILRRKEVEERTGFKRAHIYALMKLDQFPKAMRIGVRAVGWDSIEVDQWIADRRNHRA